MAKITTRKQMLSLMNGLDPQQLAEQSLAACRKLCRMDEFKQASTVMLFLSLPDEIDTSALLDECFARQKVVAVPGVVWEPRKLQPLAFGRNWPTKQGRHGLRVPRQEMPIPPGEIDLIIVPGLGFDERGNRLGRGGGFYDRFLSGNGFRGASCGLALEKQIVESVPVFEHDVPMNMLVTEKSVRRFNHA